MTTRRVDAIADAAPAPPPYNDLRESVTGSVIEPDDDGFGDAVRIWNAMIDKQPRAIIQAASVADIIETVDFARAHDLELSIKAGGHNIAGLGLSDGGLTLDLSRMRNVTVDVPAATATVEPGCTLGDVDRATQEYGLATPLGFVSETGVAGLTVGGGFGYLTRQFGWTVDSLLEVDVVTADGTIKTASRDEHSELFWAVRGGGGNFGVVTRFVFRLYEVGPEITAGLIAWSADDAEAVTDLFRRVTESAPRSLTLAMLMRNAPPAPWLESDKHGKPMIAFVVCHVGTPDEAASDLAEIRAFGQPWADLIQVKEYTGQQAMLDATQPRGMRYYWKSEFLPELSADLLDDYRAQFEGTQAPANQIVLFHVAGALARFAEDDGAVGNRDAAYACVIQAMSPTPEAVEADRAWVRSAWTTLRKYSTGGNYVNFQTHEETDDRTETSYRGNFDRLRLAKTQYDPANFFRVNRNIQPM